MPTESIYVQLRFALATVIRMYSSNGRPTSNAVYQTCQCVSQMLLGHTLGDLYSRLAMTCSLACMQELRAVLCVSLDAKQHLIAASPAAS